MATGQTGQIKRLVRDRGFGFISPDGGSSNDDLFFHRSAVQDVSFDDLAEGTRVRYEVGRSPKGPRAEDVRVA